MNTLTMQNSTHTRLFSLSTGSISQLVDRAADVIAPVWPLKTFIAVNPLQNLEHLPFEEAVLTAEQIRNLNGAPSAGRDAVNRELIKWCSAYFDEGQSTIVMPGRELGLYNAFADLARFDRRLNRTRAARSLLESLPGAPDEAVAQALDHLAVPEPLHEDFIRQALAALPGWSGYVKWKQEWQDPAEHALRPATLLDYVAVRLILTCLLWPEARVHQAHATPPPSFLRDLSIKEAQFRGALLTRLQSQAGTIAAAPAHRPEAQLVFCIDVRSEPFRRAIEAQGAYETLGFAGFFGLPVRVQGYDDDQAHASCPVLLSPCHDIQERATAAADPALVARHALGRTVARLPISFYQWLKYNLATPLALAEMLGPWLGLRMLGRTFAPTLVTRLAQFIRDRLIPPVPTEPNLDSLNLAQQTMYAEAVLRLMGLTHNLAPLVVFCGHGSDTTNNAYASALDCGACGGNHGGANARILAAILNNPNVRQSLADRGIPIPDDTLFIAAQHNTTTDHVELFPPQKLTPPQQVQLNQLRANLARAQVANAQARSSKLNPTRSPNSATQDAKRRSCDWAEVRPEWGLAQNAAFIVGPRALTRSLNLEGRCFLHSHDWEADPDGKFLTTILTAPVVVAQWINSQYLFSTLDNIAYGSGSKVTHNITGKLGVMQGNASDLMHGLPLQSVFSAHDQPYHEPIRLLTVVYAPRSSLDRIIQTSDVLKQLFGNGWVTLACIEPYENQAYLLNRALIWESASTAGPSLDMTPTLARQSSPLADLP